MRDRECATSSATLTRDQIACQSADLNSLDRDFQLITRTVNCCRSAGSQMLVSLSLPPPSPYPPGSSVRFNAPPRLSLFVHFFFVSGRVYSGRGSGEQPLFTVRDGEKRATAYLCSRNCVKWICMAIIIITTTSARRFTYVSLHRSILCVCV